MSSRVQEVKLSDFLVHVLEKYGNSTNKKNIVVEAAALLGRFTYKDLLKFLYSNRIYIKQETVKRIIRKLKEEGSIEECGEYKRQKIWCWTADSEFP